MNIKINNQMYTINSNPISSRNTYTGKAYRLQVGSDLLAVKIYRTNKLYSDEEQDEWFPLEEEVDTFMKLADDVEPILLSRMIVGDEKKDYVGCANYYITEVHGDTRKSIFYMPITKFFECFFDLEEKIPIFTNNFIMLDDWNIDNIKYGIISKDPDRERIYMFDDSNYRLACCSKKLLTLMNEKCFDNLAIDIVDSYVKGNWVYGEYHDYFESVRDKKHLFEYLEKDSRGYPNMSTYFNDIVKSKRYM